MAGPLEEEDYWVRIFDVSEPRRSFAGHTLYRVSSKVFPKDFPEAVTEVVVWKRYSDFKKLHKDLLKIYTLQRKEGNFPAFPKGKYFGRFEDAVIEARRKSALQLLKFVGNISQLFTNQYFVKFFEGGIPQSPTISTSSITSSDCTSDHEDEGSPSNNTETSGKTDSKLEMASLEVGGVWLCKQPSLVEGIDNAGLSEDSDTKRPHTPENATDLQPQILEIPTYISTPLDVGAPLNEEDVFTENVCEEDEGDKSEDSDQEPTLTSSTSEPTPKWLQRAISLCSEGEDLEVLASEADNEEFGSELDFPRAFSEVEEDETRGSHHDSSFHSDLHNSSSENFADISHGDFELTFESEGRDSGEPDFIRVREPKRLPIASTTDTDSFGDFQEAEFIDKHDKTNVDIKKGEHSDRDNYTLEENLEIRKKLRTKRGESDNTAALTFASHDRELPQVTDADGVKSTCLSKELTAQHATVSRLENEHQNPNSAFNSEDVQFSLTSSSESEKAPCRITTHDVSIVSVGAGDSDYLFAAAHTIRKALDCEVNGRYEEAFNLYRTCVSLLLNGVQGEKDVKRREAVRRKTAQYLLKAEALYTAYLHDLQKSEASSSDQDKTKDSTPEPTSSQSVVNRDRSPQGNQIYKDVVLADLKVIGIVGKVMLVENVCSKETFVIKVLQKTEGAHSRRSSRGGESKRRRLLKRAYATCPFMVRLYKYYETSSSIFLLLEYARGGRLWDYVSSYLRPIESQEYILSKRDSQDVPKMDPSSSSSSEEDLHVNAPIRAREELRNLDFKYKRDVDSRDVPLGGDANETTMKTLGVFKQDSCVERAPGIESNQRVRSRSPSPGVNALQRSDRTQVNMDSNSANVRDTDSRNKDKTEATRNEDTESLFARLDEYFNSSPCNIPEEYIRTWIAEIILALAHLHSIGIICKDLNPNNLLLDEDGHILLTNFSTWEEVDHHVDELAVEECYSAPELSKLEEVTKSADWWSIGILLYELVMGNTLASCHPWGFHSHSEIQFSRHVSPEAQALTRELLRVAPSERLGSGVSGVEDIKSHPFFAGINWRELNSQSLAR